MSGGSNNNAPSTTKKCGLTELLVFLIALITGTACSVCSKVMMDLKGEGMTGQEEVFRKPLFQTFGMFVGMMFGLVMHSIVVFFAIPFPGYNHQQERQEEEQQKEGAISFFSSSSKKNNQSWCCYSASDGDDDHNHFPLYQLSPELAAVCGTSSPLSKPDVLQTVTDYIRYRELQQDAAEEAITTDWKIRCDEKLKRIVNNNKEMVTMSIIQKCIDKHLNRMNNNNGINNGTKGKQPTETSKLLLTPNKFEQEGNKKHQQTTSFWSMFLILAIPSILDLGATALCMMGLRYLDVSLYQLLRGSGIIFVALLKQYALRNKLYKFQWVGVVWNVVAVILVGLTAVLGDEEAEQGSSGGEETTAVVVVSSSGGSAFGGVLFVLAGALVQAMQYVYEEHIMTSDNDALDAVPPLYLIGMEGFWGTFFCVTLLYPIAYIVPGDDHGSYENFENTWHMLMHTPSIQIMFGVYFVAIFGYNLFAVLVTFLMNSIWHAILDNFRPLTVWMVDLALFYLLAGAFGAPWNNHWSWLQLAGMIVLLYGTAIYNAPNDGSILLKTGTWYSLGMDFTKEYETIRREKRDAELDAEFEARMIGLKRNNSSFMGERSPFLSKAASLGASAGRGGTGTARPLATTTSSAGNNGGGGTFV